MVVKYCFCLYWLWIVTYRNKWIYLKIHILCLSLFYILLTLFNLNFNNQTHFHCSSSSGVSDLALIRIPARQKEIRPSSYIAWQAEWTVWPRPSFLSLTFFIALWGQDRKLILSKWLPAKPRVPRKDLSEGQGVQIVNIFPSFLSVKLWQTANNRHPSKYHLAEKFMRPFTTPQFYDNSATLNFNPV